MNLLDALPSLLSRLTGKLESAPVNVTFTPALPPSVRTQILNQPLTLTVSNSAGNQITFTSPSGANFTATVSPALPVGTQLQLSAAEVLPQASQAGQPAAPSNAPPAIQARILPPSGNATGTVATPAVQLPAQPLAPTPSQPATPVINLTNTNTTTPALKNLITTTLLQAIAPSTNTPTQPLPVPAGPVAATLPATLSQAAISQPLTLTPTAPMQPNGTQTATLTSPALAQPVTVTLNLGVSLPVNQPQPAMLVPPTVPQATQPTLILTGASNAQPVVLPQQIQLQPAPQMQTNPQAAKPEITPPTIPMAGRILPPVPNQPATTQTALLANGATVPLTLSSTTSQPLPTGSIIVADFPITPSANVQRILVSDNQTPQTQTGTAQQNNPAVPPQTTQAVLSPGMMLHGTLSGQNEAGQLLITLSQPPAMAGQVAALNLTQQGLANSALLPVGAQVIMRMDTSLAATLLGLTLPAQTQAAYTVGTIGSQWTNLQQGLSVLQQQAPTQAANLRASLPQLSNLMPGLIAFVNALSTNDMEKALDRDATKLLKSLGIDLSSDISQLSQLQQRPPLHHENQWRGTIFPYVEAPGEDPRQGGFFWRREKKDDPRAPTSTRFVVEVEMSRMGAMQLDGLISYPDIWLKLRRTSTTEDGFTEQLQSLVSNLLQTYGLNGGISVETTSTFPVNPRAELLAETENPLPTSA